MGCACCKSQPSVAAADMFDQECDICQQESGLKAMGFCRQCEQYLCTQCSKYHERGNITKYHTTVSKSVLEEVSRMRPLFERHLVPLSVQTVPKVQDSKLIENTQDIASLCFIDGSSDCAVLCTEIYMLRTSLWIMRDHGFSQKHELDAWCKTVIASSTSTNTLLCTAPYKSKIIQTDISIPKLTHKTLLRTSGQCWGLAEMVAGYVVSIKVETGYSFPNWQIQYLDYTGNIKQHIVYDSQGKPLFSEAQCLASNQERDIVFVADTIRHCVLALGLTGNILFTYRSESLKCPQSLAVDQEQNIYIACEDMVLQVHKDGNKHRMIIRKAGQTAFITCVGFNRTSGILATGEESTNIKMFTFLP